MVTIAEAQGILSARQAAQVEARTIYQQQQSNLQKRSDYLKSINPQFAGKTFYYQLNPQKYTEARAAYKEQIKFKETETAKVNEEQARLAQYEEEVLIPYEAQTSQLQGQVSGAERERQAYNVAQKYYNRGQYPTGEGKRVQYYYSEIADARRPRAQQISLPEGAIGSAVGGGYLFETPTGVKALYPVASAVGGGVLYAELGSSPSLNSLPSSISYGNQSRVSGGTSIPSNSSSNIRNSLGLSSQSYSSSARTGNQTFSGSNNYQLSFASGGISPVSSVSNQPSSSSVTQRFFTGFTNPIRQTFSSPRNFATTVALGIGAAALASISAYVAIGIGVAAIGYEGYRFLRSPSAESAGEFAFIALPVVATAGYRGVSSAAGLPRSTSRFLARSTTSEISLEGTNVETIAAVETTQTGLTGSRQYLSFLRGRSVINQEGQQFIARTGVVGVTAESQGINPASARSAGYINPKVVGSVALTSGTSTGEQFFGYSFIRSRIQGVSNPTYSVGAEGGVALTDTITASVGRTAPFQAGRLSRVGSNTFGGFTSFEAAESSGSGFVYTTPRGSITPRPTTTNPIVQSFNEAQILSATNQAVPRPNIINEISTASTITSPSSIYAGTGNYERTDFVRPVAYNVAAPLDYQRDISRNIISSINLSSQQERQRQSFILGQSYSQVQIPRSAIAFAQGSAQTPRFAQALAVGQPFAPASRTTPRTAFPSPLQTPTFTNPPRIVFLRGDFNLTGLGSRNYRAFRVTRYTPSFSALAFNIGGVYSANNLSRSGLDFRPITSGFNFRTGLRGRNLLRI